jgi:hypothetical protein
MLGATLFVVRVLADNLLYYTDRDAMTGGNEDDRYPSRIFLIACDLTSYAFCYAIVLRLVDTATGRELPLKTLVWVIGYFGVVEALHWWWCAVAISMVRARKESDETQRIKLLASWRRLSREATLGWAAVTGIGIALTFRVPTVTFAIAVVAFALSFASAWRYLVRMRDQYLGRELSDDAA